MTTTLNDMTAKKKPDPSAEEVAAKELVRVAQEQGLSLTGPDGLLKQFTKNVLETALNEEMTEHLDMKRTALPAAGTHPTCGTGPAQRRCSPTPPARSSSRSHEIARAPSSR